MIVEAVLSQKLEESLVNDVNPVNFNEISGYLVQLGLTSHSD